MAAQALRSSEDTEFYLVNLLERFARPAQDWFSRPLAIDYLESFHSAEADRYVKLRRVADTSLFLSGMFMETLERTLVGCDYYIQLGRMAYGRLAALDTPAYMNLPFTELSQRFPEFVRVLSEISFSELFRSERQLLRVYKRWLHTHSVRDQDWLIRHGLIPVRGSERTRH